MTALLARQPAPSQIYKPPTATPPVSKATPDGALIHTVMLSNLAQKAPPLVTSSTTTVSPAATIKKTVGILDISSPPVVATVQGSTTDASKRLPASIATAVNQAAAKLTSIPKASQLSIDPVQLLGMARGTSTAIQLAKPEVAAVQPLTAINPQRAIVSQLPTTAINTQLSAGAMSTQLAVSAIPSQLPTGVIASQLSVTSSAVGQLTAHPLTTQLNPQGGISAQLSQLFPSADGVRQPAATNIDPRLLASRAAYPAMRPLPAGGGSHLGKPKGAVNTAPASYTTSEKSTPSASGTTRSRKIKAPQHMNL